MKKFQTKFTVLDNGFIFLFGIQLILFVTFIYFKSEIISWMPSIFQNESDASLIVFSVSLSSIVLVKIIDFYAVKKYYGKSTETKFSVFAAVSIIKLTLLAVSNIFVLFGFLQTQSIIFLIIFLLILFLQYAYRPRIDSFQKDFKISNDELNIL